MTKAAIFLDFDGPLSNYRTALAKGEFLWGSFDPITIEALLHICAAADAKIVCTSTRAEEHPATRAEIFRLFDEAGFDRSYIHHDWTCNFGNEFSRENHIKKWLSRHPEIESYAIVDDEKVDLPNLILVDGQDGMLLKDFEAVAKKLGVELLEAFRHGQLQNVNQSQLKLPLDAGDVRYNEHVLT